MAACIYRYQTRNISKALLWASSNEFYRENVSEPHESQSGRLQPPDQVQSMRPPSLRTVAMNMFLPSLHIPISTVQFLLNPCRFSQSVYLKLAEPSIIMCPLSARLLARRNFALKPRTQMMTKQLHLRPPHSLARHPPRIQAARNQKLVRDPTHAIAALMPGIYLGAS